MCMETNDSATHGLCSDSEIINAISNEIEQRCVLTREAGQKILHASTIHDQNANNDFPKNAKRVCEYTTIT